MSAYPTVTGPDPKQDLGLAALIDQLGKKHHDAICATLVYGSCLRSGDIYDGLLDLYLICDNYRAAYGVGLPALGNWVLPPNVFYAQYVGQTKTLRAKVTVISLRDFQKGCSPAWFESYIWGRFSQPTHILQARDADVQDQIEEALLEAGRTLLQRALPALPPSGSIELLWEQALGLSYNTELRTERSGRAAELVQSASAFYRAVTAHHAHNLGYGFTLNGSTDEGSYATSATSSQRSRAKISWGLRRAQGKIFSIARLLKALFTFEGGLDYIAWKLERHSGEEVVIPPKVRKAPLIYLWGFFWGLYRRGIFK